jgi:hypothetical protein
VNEKKKHCIRLRKGGKEAKGRLRGKGSTRTVGAIKGDGRGKAEASESEGKNEG